MRFCFSTHSDHHRINIIPMNSPCTNSILLDFDCLFVYIYLFVRSVSFTLTFSSLQVASPLLFVCVTLLSDVILAEFNVAPNVLDRPDDERLALEPIGIGAYDFFTNQAHDVSDKPWNESDHHHHMRSLRLAKCEKLQSATCFGAKVAWPFTSIQLSNEASQANSTQMLYQLEASRFVPGCWAVVQPFLCAVYMPKCIRSTDRDYVYLPSLEMCRVTYEPCRILYENDFFPRHLQCNRHVFPCENCTNAVRELKFNATGQCMLPLVPTESSINHYPGRKFARFIPRFSLISLTLYFVFLRRLRYRRMRIAMQKPIVHRCRAPVGADADFLRCMRLFALQFICDCNIFDT